MTGLAYSWTSVGLRLGRRRGLIINESAPRRYRRSLPNSAELYRRVGGLEVASGKQRRLRRQQVWYGAGRRERSVGRSVGRSDGRSGLADTSGLGRRRAHFAERAIEVRAAGGPTRHSISQPASIYSLLQTPPPAAAAGRRTESKERV